MQAKIVTILALLISSCGTAPRGDSQLQAVSPHWSKEMCALQLGKSGEFLIKQDYERCANTLSQQLLSMGLMHGITLQNIRSLIASGDRFSDIIAEFVRAAAWLHRSCEILWDETGVSCSRVATGLYDLARGKH